MLKVEEFLNLFYVRDTENGTYLRGEGYFTISPYAFSKYGAYAALHQWAEKNNVPHVYQTRNHYAVKVATGTWICSRGEVFTYAFTMNEETAYKVLEQYLSKKKGEDKVSECFYVATLNPVISGQLQLSLFAKGYRWTKDHSEVDQVKYTWYDYLGVNEKGIIGFRGVPAGYKKELSIKEVFALPQLNPAAIFDLGDSKVELNEQNKEVTYKDALNAVHRQSYAQALAVLSTLFELSVVGNKLVIEGGTFTLGCLHGDVDKLRELYEVLKDSK